MEKITGGRDGRGVAGITGSNSRQRRSCRAVIDRGASIGSPCWDLGTFSTPPRRRCDSVWRRHAAKWVVTGIRELHSNRK